MPKVPPAQGPGRLSWDAQSDAAALAQRVQVLEAIVFELVGSGTADPSPQPSTQSMLLDPKLRLESVERLTKRFESGLKQLKEERDFLSTKIG